MVNYINKYSTLSDYEADETKQYPNVSYVVENDEVIFMESEPQFQGKWLATYTGGTTSSAECDSTSAITYGEITKNNLTELELGNCVTSIGESAFRHYQSLTSCTIGNSVTSIGSEAFFNCDKLTSLVIPDSVTSIGNDAFRECYVLSSCTFGSGVTSIGSDAFYACIGITSIDIPSGVTSIGNEAFIYCTAATSITVNAITPPALGYSAFDGSDNCPIFVPAESVNAYKTAANWSSYSSRIQAIP